MAKGKARIAKGKTCISGEVVLSLVEAVTRVGKGCVVFGCVCRQQVKACGSALAVSVQNKHGWKYTAPLVLALTTLVTVLLTGCPRSVPYVPPPQLGRSLAGRTLKGTT